MPPRKTNKANATIDTKPVPKKERRFASRDDLGNLIVNSDERGDVAVILASKVGKVLGVTVEGLWDKEPVLFIHFDGGGVCQVTYNSRTNVFSAQKHVLELLSEPAVNLRLDAGNE